MSSPPTASDTIACPRCGSATAGRFCASCGAPVQGAICGACASALSPGARFCHRCGSAVGSEPPRKDEPRWLATALPWSIAGIALLALVALVAGQRFNARPAPAQPTDGLAQNPGMLDPRRAPDISTLSPRDRADRLYDHVMRTQSEGKVDSMQFFARMAVDAYGSLPELDLDARYDLGRIAEAAGALGVAAAQADSILSRAPTHLLGLILATSVAEQAGNAQRAREMRQRLLQAADAEKRKPLPEYQRHDQEIERAITMARGAPR